MGVSISSRECYQRVNEIGAIPIGSTPEGLAATIRDTTARWKKVIDAANIRIE